MLDAIIVGGGIAGLAAAYELARAGLRFVLLERRNRAGGLVLSERVDGFAIDAGPDALLTQKPDAIALCRELGLGDRLVPTKPDDPAAAANRAAWATLGSFQRPFLTAFSDSDPITGGGDAIFRRLVPGAKGQPHTTIEGGGHFLQEDKGPELARVIADFVAGT